MIEEPYLRTKEKYRIDLKVMHFDRLLEMFETFGPGVYWSHHGLKNHSRLQYYEGWLTQEELTQLKLAIPEIRFMKLMIDK